MVGVRPDHNVAFPLSAVCAAQAASDVSGIEVGDAERRKLCPGAPLVSLTNSAAENQATRWAAIANADAANLAVPVHHSCFLMKRPHAKTDLEILLEESKCGFWEKHLL